MASSTHFIYCTSGTYLEQIWSSRKMVCMGLILESVQLTIHLRVKVSALKRYSNLNLSLSQYYLWSVYFWWVLNAQTPKLLTELALVWICFQGIYYIVLRMLKLLGSNKILDVKWVMGNNSTFPIIDMSGRWTVGRRRHAKFQNIYTCGVLQTKCLPQSA